MQPKISYSLVNQACILESASPLGMMFIYVFVFLLAAAGSYCMVNATLPNYPKKFILLLTFALPLGGLVFSHRLVSGQLALAKQENPNVCSMVELTNKL
jgi:hypothetical protein